MNPVAALVPRLPPATLCRASGAHAGAVAGDGIRVLDAVDGNTITWTTDCPEQKSKGKGQVTFTEDTYVGWMKMTINEQEMTTKYSGKWLGTCKK